MFEIKVLSKFPSWTSRVRVPSPAPYSSTTCKQFPAGWRQLAPKSIHSDSSFEFVHRRSAGLKPRFGVRILIDVHSVPHLLRPNLRIDLQLLQKRAVGPPHHLKVHPFEADWL